MFIVYVHVLLGDIRLNMLISGLMNTLGMYIYITTVIYYHIFATHFQNTVNTMMVEFIKIPNYLVHMYM